MARPKRPRFIESRPDVQGFIPDGIDHTGDTTLPMEEFEAIRLSDYLGLDQSQAAEQMNVSRQTFGRILKQARFTLSQALVTGKRLRVTGGCYEMQTPNRGRRRRGRNPMEQKEENMNQEQTTDNQTNQDKDPTSAQGTGRGMGRGKGQGQGRGQGAGQGRGKGQGQGPDLAVAEQRDRPLDVADRRHRGIQRGIGHLEDARRKPGVLGNDPRQIRRAAFRVQGKHLDGHSRQARQDLGIENGF